MGDVMTLAALGEACQHGCRVRCAVTALAGWNCLVLVFVTGNTGNGLMFRICFDEMLCSFFVAGCAHFVCCVRGIGYRGRHMGLVATFAVG